MDRPTRPRLLAALLVGALMVGLTLTGSIVPAQAADGTVSGTVTDADTGAPVGGVDVQAVCWQVNGVNPGEICGEAETAANGTYSISVPPGVHKVWFDHYPHHANQYYGGGTVIDDVDSTQVTVTSGGSATGIDVALEPLRTVSGTVKGTGTPVGGINVTAYQLSSGPSPTWEPTGFAVTAPDGTYDLQVQDGTYRVGFSDAHGPYRTVFYDGAATVEAGNDVVVAGDVDGIDADMGRNYPVTGAVTVDGIDMPGVIVTAYRASASSPSGWEAVKYTETGSTEAMPCTWLTAPTASTSRPGRAASPPSTTPGSSTIDEAEDVVVDGADGARTSASPSSAATSTRGRRSGGRSPSPTEARRLRASTSPLAVRPGLPGPGSRSGPARRCRTAPMRCTCRRAPTGSASDSFNNRYQTVYYEDATRSRTPTDVVHAQQGVAGIDIEVVENLSISGVVTADPVPDLPPGPAARPRSRPGGGTSAALDWGGAGTAFTRPDGRYELYVAEGTYRIEFTDLRVRVLRPLFYDEADSIGEAEDVVMDDADITGHRRAPGRPDDEPPRPGRSAGTLSGRRSGRLGSPGGGGPRGDAPWPSGPTGGRRQPGAGERPPDVGRGTSRPSSRLSARTRSTRGWPGRRRHERRRMAPLGRQPLPRRGDAPVRNRVLVNTGDPVEPGSRCVGPAGGVGQRSGPPSWCGARRTRPGPGPGEHPRRQAGAWSAPTDLSDDREARGIRRWPSRRTGRASSCGHDRTIRTSRCRRVRLSRAGTGRLARTSRHAGRDAGGPAGRGRTARCSHGGVAQLGSGPTSGSRPTTRTSGGAMVGPGRRFRQRARTPTTRRSRWIRAGRSPLCGPGGTGAPTGYRLRREAPGETWSAPADPVRAGQERPTRRSRPARTARRPRSGTSRTASECVMAAIRSPAAWSVPTSLTEQRHARRRAAGRCRIRRHRRRRMGAPDRGRTTGIEGAVRIDPGGPDHCHNEGGVDLNIVFGVPEQLVDGTCRTVNARARWRPLTTWYHEHGVRRTCRRASSRPAPLRSRTSWRSSRPSRSCRPRHPDSEDGGVHTGRRPWSDRSSPGTTYSTSDLALRYRWQFEPAEDGAAARGRPHRQGRLDARCPAL